MKRFAMVAVLAGIAGSLLTAAALSQDKKADSKDQAAADAMAKWQAFLTPGPEHKRLEFKVGKWNVTTRMWQAPDTAPEESTGIAEYKMILGGRYVLDNTVSSFAGGKFEGMGLTGFDNIKKRYVVNWIDNFGTGFMPGDGVYDEKTKTFHYTFDAPDVENGRYKKARSVERIVDADTWIMEMYDKTPQGKEFMNLQLSYKRVKL